MNMKRLHLGLGALLLASCNLLCAGDFWNPMSWFRADGGDVLIVTGNYGRPRLLAELVQRRDRIRGEIRRIEHQINLATSPT